MTWLVRAPPLAQRPWRPELRRLADAFQGEGFVIHVAGERAITRQHRGGMRRDLFTDC